MHGITQGAIAGVSGGSFWQGFVAGSVSSTVSSISMGVNHAANLSATAGDVSTMFFGSVSGGLSAELSGGNFWQGAAIGLVVSGLNHVMHRSEIDSECWFCPKDAKDGTIHKESLWESSVYLNVEGQWVEIPDNINYFEYKGASLMVPRVIGGSGSLSLISGGGSFKILSAFKSALGLSGGISSTIAGGSFWAGARQGLITSGLNHVAHKIEQRNLVNERLKNIGLNGRDKPTVSTSEIDYLTNYDPTLNSMLENANNPEIGIDRNLKVAGTTKTLTDIPMFTTIR